MSLKVLQKLNVNFLNKMYLFLMFKKMPKLMSGESIGHMYIKH